MYVRPARNAVRRADQGPAPAIHVSVDPARSDWGVFFKVAPETLQIGDRVAFSAHDVGWVTEVVALDRGILQIGYVCREGHAGPELTRRKRRGTATVALISRDGQRREAPAGTRFD